MCSFLLMPAKPFCIMLSYWNKILSWIVKENIFREWKLKISFSQNQFSIKHTNFEEWKGTRKNRVQVDFLLFLLYSLSFPKNMSAFFLEKSILENMSDLRGKDRMYLNITVNKNRTSLAINTCHWVKKCSFLITPQGRL